MISYNVCTNITVIQNEIDNLEAYEHSRCIFYANSELPDIYNSHRLIWSHTK